MFNGNAGSAAVNAQIFACTNLLFIIAAVFAIILSTPVFRLIKEKVSATKFAAAGSYIAYAGSLLIFALSILSLVSSKYNPFIYFRF